MTNPPPKILGHHNTNTYNTPYKNNQQPNQIPLTLSPIFSTPHTPASELTHKDTYECSHPNNNFTMLHHTYLYYSWSMKQPEWNILNDTHTKSQLINSQFSILNSSILNSSSISQSLNFSISILNSRFSISQFLISILNFQSPQFNSKSKPTLKQNLFII